MPSEDDAIEIPNPNHPKLGDTIRVEPIRTVNAVNKIKKVLLPTRNFALFVVGVNTAYGASELLSIRVGHLNAGDRLAIKQRRKRNIERPHSTKALLIQFSPCWFF